MTATADPPLRIALVGCGHISATHLAAWRRIPAASVVALCDVSPAALALRQREFAIDAGFESLSRLLRETEVDAVDICTTPEQRLDVMTEAARAGKHLLVQKPLAASVAEGWQMCALADACGVQLGIKENWRWYPWYRCLAAELHAGRAGAVARLAIRRTCWGSIDPQWRVWREQPYLMDRPLGVWYEVGVHLVDTLRHLLGEPQDICADFATMSRLMRGEDVAHVVMTFGSAVVTVDLSWAERGRPSRPSVDGVEVDGSLCRMVVRDDGSVRRIDDTGATSTLLSSVAAAELGSHVASQADFVSAIRERRAPATSGRHHLRTLAIVMAGYDSARTRSRIDLRSAA